MCLPQCGKSVIARQGDVNQWHFAHDNIGESMKDERFVVLKLVFFTIIVYWNPYGGVLSLNA